MCEAHDTSIGFVSRIKAHVSDSNAHKRNFNPSPTRGSPYMADECPLVDSPEFLKKYPLDNSLESYKRMLAAAANGYGD